jgi:transposase InsO family protein
LSATTRPSGASTHRRAERRSWCRPQDRTRSGSATSPSSRHGWAASGGSAASPTTGRKWELGYHVATTQNHRDAIETVELALTETKRLLGRPLLDAVTNKETGEIRPVALVTDNGPCFKSARFAAFVDAHPELIHIRTRRKSPGQNGVRERAFGSLKYEHLYRHEIDDGHDLGLHVERYRQLFNQIRPHEVIGMQRPLDIHLEAINDDQTLKSTEPETLPLP